MTRRVVRPAVEGLEGRKLLSSFSSDRMGNFEIQRLMSAFNQAETLAGNTAQKSDDTRDDIIGKLG